MRFFSIYFNLFFKSYSYTYRILIIISRLVFAWIFISSSTSIYFVSTPSLLTPSRKRVVLSSSSQFPDLSKATSHTCAVKQFLGLEFPCSMANLLRGRCWELARGHELFHFEGLSKESTSRPLEKKKWLVVMLSGGGKDKGTDVGSVVWHHLDTRIPKMERRFERRCFTFLNWHGFYCLVIWQI